MANKLSNYPVTRDATADLTNPATTDGALLTTGALDGGIYDIVLTLAQSAAAKYIIARRNAANGADVGDSVIIYGPAAGTLPLVLRYEINPDERVILSMHTNLTGTAALSLQAQRVA